MWFGLYVLIRPVDRKEFEGRTFPHAYDVLVYQEGGHYYAKDRNGSVICTDSPSACIQEAVQWIKANGGGRILIKRGEYNVHQTIDLGQGDLKLKIEGEDMWSTILTTALDIDVFRAVAVGPNAGVRLMSIENLTIRGNGQGRGLVLGATQRDVLQYAALITIRRVFFDSLKQAVYANNLWISKIEDVIVNGGVPGGPPLIQLDENGVDTSHDIYITRLYSEGINSIPISMPARSYYIVVDQAFIDGQNNVDYLIYMDPMSMFNVVKYSYLAGAKSYAIYASPGSKIIGNLIWYSNNGIYSIGSIIIGNTITDLINIAVYIKDSLSETVVGGNSIQFANIGVYSVGNRAIIKGNRLYSIKSQAIWVYYYGGNIIEGNVIHQAQTSGGAAIIEIEGQYHLIKGNFIESDYGQYAIFEGDGNNNIIVNNIVFKPMSIRWVGPNTIVRNNAGFVTTKSGTETIRAGTTSVTVSHGMSCMPKMVLVTPLAQHSGSIWVSEIASTTFTINTSTAPSIDLPVAWYAEC